MANLVDIFKNLLTGIELQMEVTNIAGNQVFVCNTLHTTVNKIVTDSFGNEYLVTNMLANVWLELTPQGAAPAFFDSVVFAPPVYFVHGTPQMANNEYLLIGQNALDKTPFVWLLENYRFTSPEGDSALSATYSVVLFVLDWSKDNEWTNDQINDIVIKPMENLSNAIIGSINSNWDFRRLEDVQKIPRSRFGVEVTNKGNKRKIFNDDLSGIEMRFTLEVRDLDGCC